LLRIDIPYNHNGQKNDHISSHFLLNKDISQLLNEMGHKHKKIQFYEENTFFMSQLHGYIPKYYQLYNFYVCRPKYLIFAQFLPNSCITFSARYLYIRWE